MKTATIRTQFETWSEPWRWFISLFALAALILAAPTAKADIYYWTDDQGVIHFSNQDAPAGASLYMKEPATKVESPSPDEPDHSASAVEQEMKEEIDRTNQRLERALDRVDELTERVRDSQQEAAVSAALARQAAEFSLAGAAQVASEPEREVNRRVVYYGAPILPHAGRIGSRGKSFHFSHRKFKHLNKFKHHKEKLHHGKKGRHHRIQHHRSSTHRLHNGIRHNPRLNTIHRSRIPKAYGIR